LLIRGCFDSTTGVINGRVNGVWDRSGPSDYVSACQFHWYVSVIPRLTRVAGFELGSGVYINTVLPEAAAEFLRNVRVENAAGAGPSAG
jgi:hypothetical protein